MRARRNARDASLDMMGDVEEKEEEGVSERREELPLLVLVSPPSEPMLKPMPWAYERNCLQGTGTHWIASLSTTCALQHKQGASDVTRIWLPDGRRLKAEARIGFPH